MLRVFKTVLLLIILPYLSYSQKSATIYGTTDSEELKVVNISRFPSFLTEFRNELISNALKKDNAFTLAVKLNKPELLVFNIIGKNWEVYVKPGDSIRFFIHTDGSNKKATFYGKNAANYNLLNELSEILNRKDSVPKYTKYKDLAVFKKAVENWIFKQKDFIKKYTQTYKITPDFNKLLQENIDYEYATLLYSSVNDHKIKADSVPENYLESADLLSFHRDDLLPLNNYRNALRAKYVHNYTKIQNADFETIYKNSLEATLGKTRELLLCTIISIYSHKQEIKDSAMLRIAINDARNNISDTTYLKEIKKSSDRYFTLNKKIPNHILDSSKFSTYSSNTKITLREVLKTYEGKAVYIDLWASWCAPCRDDIANSSKTKSWMLSKNIAYVYFSIDSDAENWRSTAVEDHITEHQYLIEGSLASSLIKFLDVRYIPRYILLNDQHQVVNLYSPRPNDENLPQLSTTINALTAKVVTFN